MGTLTGQYIADGAWTKANEGTGTTAVRWPPAEALRWINNGQRECVNQLPRSNTVRANPTVVSGSRQDLTGLGLTTGIQVIDVICNMNAAGTTRGSPIKRMERAWLDDNLPGWHVATATEAAGWVQDDRDPKAFYIYPAPTAGNKVELIYAAAPTDLASLANTITLDDIYANALEFFMLYSFYSKETTYAANTQAAAGYWQQFLQCLGVRSQSTMMNAQTVKARAEGQ